LFCVRLCCPYLNIKICYFEIFHLLFWRDCKFRYAMALNFTWIILCVEIDLQSITPSRLIPEVGRKTSTCLFNQVKHLQRSYGNGSKNLATILRPFMVLRKILRLSFGKSFPQQVSLYRMQRKLIENVLNCFQLAILGIIM